jgi:hypothetical protein
VHARTWAPVSIPHRTEANAVNTHKRRAVEHLPAARHPLPADALQLRQAGQWHRQPGARRLGSRAIAAEPAATAQPSQHQRRRPLRSCCPHGAVAAGPPASRDYRLRGAAPCGTRDAEWAAWRRRVRALWVHWRAATRGKNGGCVQLGGGEARFVVQPDASDAQRRSANQANGKREILALA